MEVTLSTLENGRVAIVHNGQQIEDCSSETRARKRCRQKGWIIQQTTEIHVSVLAKEIRTEGELWAEAMRRAHQLKNQGLK